jgi:rubrerythrin
MSWRAERMNSEKIILKYLQEMLKYDTTAYLSYSTLRKNVTDERVLQTLTEIAIDEKKHVEILEALIEKTKQKIERSR